MQTATTNALRVPGQTATLKLLQLTSFAKITTPNASADAAVAGRALLSSHCAHVVTAFPET